MSTSDRAEGATHFADVALRLQLSPDRRAAPAAPILQAAPAPEFIRQSSAHPEPIRLSLSPELSRTGPRELRRAGSDGPGLRSSPEDTLSDTRSPERSRADTTFTLRCSTVEYDASADGSVRVPLLTHPFGGQNGAKPSVPAPVAEPHWACGSLAETATTALVCVAYMLVGPLIILSNK